MTLSTSTLPYIRSVVLPSGGNENGNTEHVGRYDPTWEEWIHSRKTKGWMTGVVVGCFLLVCGAVLYCRHVYKKRMASAEASAKRDLEMRARMLY